MDPTEKPKASQGGGSGHEAAASRLERLWRVIERAVEAAEVLKAAPAPPTKEADDKAAT